MTGVQTCALPISGNGKVLWTNRDTGELVKTVQVDDPKNGYSLTAAPLLIDDKLNPGALWPAAAQSHPGTAITALLLLASISGGIPLLIYFEGLRLTRASTAGYFEMMQTLAAVCITWGFFHAALHPHQVIAGIVLMVAVAMIQQVQRRSEGMAENIEH